MFVLGGNGGGGCAGLLNDVYRSQDGETWVQSTAAAKWSKRDGHSALACGNYIYVIGGYGSDQLLLNDVWKSMDGRHWQKVGDGGFPARCWPSTVVHQGKIYLMGGWGNEGKLNDVWQSEDCGKTWTMVINLARWPKQDSMQAISWDNDIILFGGRDAHGLPQKTGGTFISYRFGDPQNTSYRFVFWLLLETLKIRFGGRIGAPRYFHFHFLPFRNPNAGPATGRSGIGFQHGPKHTKKCSHASTRRPCRRNSRTSKQPARRSRKKAEWLRQRSLTARPQYTRERERTPFLSRILG
jgi:hypothetical protein